MNRRFSWPLVLLTVVGVAGSVTQCVFFRNTLEGLHARSVRLTSQALTPILEHAHRLNDDLTLQAVIRGLSQGSGVLYACVLDKDNTILAHTQPSQLGKSFKKPLTRSRQALWTQPLQESGVPWGSLVFSTSKRTLQSTATQHLWILILMNGFLILGVAGLVKQSSERQAADQQKIEAAEFFKRELDVEMARLQKTLEGAEASWRGCLGRSLEHLPGAVFVLDSQQKVLGCNQAAAQKIALDPERILGRSWQDVPVLAVSGEILQRSLDQLSQPIEVQLNGSTLKFLSELTPSSLCTFVFLS